MVMSAATLVATIEADIESGSLLPGDRLPSVRAEADRLSVSPTTVASAYKRLRERGYLVGRGRQGSRIAPRPPRIGPYPAIPSGIVDALSGNPDARFLPSMTAAVTAVVSDDPVLYGDELMVEPLRRAARSYFESDGIDATHMSVASGAMDAIDRILRFSRLSVGDRIGVEDPGHLPVHQIARQAGLELVPLQVDECGVTMRSVEQAMAAGVRAVVITSRAQNPTGAAFDADRARQVESALASDPSVMVIIDDHACEASGVGYVGIDLAGHRWAVIRSMAKSFGPDVRVAVVVGDDATIANLDMSVSVGPGWVSHLLQRVAAFHLDSASSCALVVAAGTSYAARRQRLIEGLNHYGLAASGASGLNVWIPVADEQAAIEAVREVGYVVRAGDSYRISSSPAVRVTVASLNDGQIDAVTAALGEHLNRRTSQSQ